MNSNEVKKAAKNFRADLIGIAAVDRFAGLPAERNPLSIFPECKSVIVVGRRVLRGSLRGIEEGTNFGSTYGCFGLQYLKDNFLAKTTYDLTCWIEEQGFEAVPLFGYSAEANMNYGVPVEPGKPAPNVIVDPDYAAQAAGVGEIGLGGFLLTPEFGPRQRVAVILTDCELEADPVMKKHLCGDCGACIEACPLKAFDAGKVSPVGVDGYGCTVAARDERVCKSCPNGATVPNGHGGIADRIGASCSRACVVQLEKNNKLGNKFNHEFRKRQPWALDLLQRPVTVNAIKVGCDASR